MAGKELAKAFLDTQTALTHLKSFGSSWNMLSSNSALVFVDDHDNQRSDRSGKEVITSKQSTVSAIVMISNTFLCQVVNGFFAAVIITTTLTWPATTYYYNIAHACNNNIRAGKPVGHQ